MLAAPDASFLLPGTFWYAMLHFGIVGVQGGWVGLMLLAFVLAAATADGWVSAAPQTL